MKLKKEKKEKKSACLDFSSGSVMQNKSLNPICTALSFELKTEELTQGCQSTAQSYNLLFCQKQSHENKITI